jgi:NAD(P)-dependent dehydrogenase (short-subunit alcohol dehydrogenase family)
MQSTLVMPGHCGLDSSVAIATGGGLAETGIGHGRAATIHLAKAGARTVVIDHTLEHADQTVTIIEARNSGFFSEIGAYGIVFDEMSTGTIGKPCATKTTPPTDT